MKQAIHLTKKEIEQCEALFNKLCDSDIQLEQELTERFEDAADIHRQLEAGVDDFYQLYQEEVNKDTTQKKLEEKMGAMNTQEKYSYLANLLVAITHICGNVFEGSSWSDMLKGHEAVLSAIELGLLDGDNEDVCKGIEEMKEIIAENIEKFAVLFVDSPDFEKLQDACVTENSKQVQALAIHTREAAVNMAAAIYILQENNELPSLEQTRYTPYDMGVMAASLLEIDAAQKSGCFETAKRVFAKASRVAVTLLVASPMILAEASILGIIAALTNFATIWLLVSGVILGINIYIYMSKLEEYMNPVFEAGAKALDITLDKVKPVGHKISNWVQNTVVPAALPVWEHCRDFTVTHILIPAAAFLLKIKTKALAVAGPFAEKAKAAANKLSVKVTDLFQAAEDVMEQERNRADECVQDDACVEDLVVDVTAFESEDEDNDAAAFSQEDSDLENSECVSV